MSDQESLSSYNNNPGNLKTGKTPHEGQIGTDANGFAVFPDADTGRKALINHITSKIESGVDTPNKFIDSYAPFDKNKPQENPEDARNNYKFHITQSLGLDDVNGKMTKDHVEKLADAITQFEGGHAKAQKHDEFVGGDNAATVAGQQGNSGALVTPNPEVQKQQKEDVDRAVSAVSALGGAGTSAGLQLTGKGISLLPYAASKYLPNKFPLTEDTTMTRSGLERWMKSGTHATNLANLNLSDLEKEYNNLMSKTDPNWKPMKLRNMKEVGAAINAMTPTKDQQVTQPIYKLVGPNRFEETGQFRTKTIPGSPGIDTSKYEFDPKNPIKSTARAVGRSAESTAKSVFPVAGKMAVGAVGGVNAITGANDAINAYDSSKSILDQSPEVYTKGAQALGGLAQITPKYMGPGSVVADAAKTAEDYKKYGINPFKNPEALRTIAHGIGTAGSAASMVPTPTTKGLGYAGMAVGMLPEAYDAYQAGKYLLHPSGKSGLPKHEDVNDTPLPFNQ